MSELLEPVKKALRLTSDVFDDEVQDLIESARSDLIQSGVSPLVAKKEDDPLIRRAVILYCKAHFGMDNPDAVRFAQSFDMLKQHLTLAGDYSGDAVE
ncbi:head-tail connector protein [Shouchella clausii]|uniref:head-tail connector protein n=1 Tax=Shouchella clausii TaxID=79880 RepID=UPI00078949C8|nr:head-tail connector protein [Shouchella clausii]